MPAQNNARSLHVAGCYLIKQLHSFQKIYLETRPGWLHRAWSKWWMDWVWVDYDHENLDESIEKTQDAIRQTFKQQ